jgi:antitoxin MazE
MEVSIIKIGNSKGFRISKSILERYNITDKLEMILEKGQIVLRPVSAPRKGWNKAFKDMHKNGDDELLMDDLFEDENLDEWK